MRCSRIVALCIIAAFALCAFAAGAQATPLAYYACVKVPPKTTGHYADGECSKPVGSGGKYERESAVGVTYKAKTKSVTFISTEMPIDGHLTCKHSSDVGMITGSSVGEDQATFTGCEAETGRCTSAGEPKGTIKAGVLKTELVGPESSPKIKFTPSHQFSSGSECGTFLLRVGGFAVGTYTAPPGGHANKKATEIFGGEENLTMEFSPNGGEEWYDEEFGGYRTEESTTAESTDSEPVGID